jgi:hypothetical protein
VKLVELRHLMRREAGVKIVGELCNVARHRKLLDGEACHVMRNKQTFRSRVFQDERGPWLHVQTNTEHLASLLLPDS